ncbi:hypothetical protein JW960_28380 [candidate division KSB1 bacterium]|nr:hypothetical protein [candidate division KSB1 bacterium]
MKNKISFFVVLGCLCCLLHNCFKITDPDDGIINDPNYPTTLNPLSASQIAQLQAEFDSLNNPPLCTTINKYGFTGDDSNCRCYQMVEMEEADVIDLAIQTVLKNSKFTNANDSILLRSTVWATSTNKIRWNVRFGPQQYHGYELPFTWIYVRIYDREAYSIARYWYKDICIPDHDNIGAQQAANKVIDEKIVWYNFGGSAQSFIVSNDDIGSPINKAIYPVETEESIKLRVTWKIPILFSGFVGWHIYLDTMTGEIVEIIQEFRT